MRGTEIEGFEAWYCREHPRLVMSLVLVAGDIHVAQDATDEAFARAFARWDRVGAMESPNGWTYRVALNVLRRRARRAAVERRLLARRAEATVVPPDINEAWDAVRHLPPRQREAIVLRYIADLTEKEVGAAMGVSRGAISSALTEARRTLSRLLADDDASLEVPCA